MQQEIYVKIFPRLVQSLPPYSLDISPTLFRSLKDFLDKKLREENHAKLTHEQPRKLEILYIRDIYTS